jgi:hypothetical protein
VETIDPTSPASPATRSAGAPPSDSQRYRVQRAVLFELLTVDAAAGGVSVGELSDRCGEEVTAIRDAVAALADVGLAETHGEAVSATRAASYFDALWPIVL